MVTEMSNNQSSVKSMLLFEDRKKLDLESLASELVAVLRNIAVGFDAVDFIDKRGVVLRSQKLELRITWPRHAYKPTRARGAARPTHSLVSTAMIDALLDDVKCGLTINVTSTTENSVSEALLLAIMYHTVRHLLRRISPALVHWRHTNTIFTVDEFELQTAAAAQEVVRQRELTKDDAFARKGVSMTETLDRLQEIMAARMEDTGNTHQSAMVEAESRLRHARNAIFGEIFDKPKKVTPRRVARHSGRRKPMQTGPVEQMAVYVMTITLMLVSLPVGMGMLIYNLFRGENLVATARAMAVTSIMVAGFSAAPITQAMAAIL